MVSKIILNAVYGKPLGKALTDAHGNRTRARLRGYLAGQKQSVFKSDCPYPEGQDRDWWIEGFKCKSVAEAYEVGGA